VRLFRAGVSVLNQTIQNATRILANTSVSLASATAQAFSNFTACVASGRGGFIFGIITAPVSCAFTVVPQQISAYVNTTRTNIQATGQMFSQLLSPSDVDSPVPSIPQMAVMAGRASATFAADLAVLGNQTIQCIAQAMNTTVTAIASMMG
jgi:hypothetical protein